MHTFCTPMQVTMQRDLDKALAGIPDCVSRIDCIVLASADPDSHTQHVSAAHPVLAFACIMMRHRCLRIKVTHAHV